MQSPGGAYDGARTIQKEREMQELLRQADKENARLEVLLEQAREQLKKENIDKDEQ